MRQKFINTFIAGVLVGMCVIVAITIAAEQKPTTPPDIPRYITHPWEYPTPEQAYERLHPEIELERIRKAFPNEKILSPDELLPAKFKRN